MGPSGPVALDLIAIEKAMDVYHIDEDERIDFSITVRKIANTVFSAQAEEAERKAEQARRKH